MRLGSGSRLRRVVAGARAYLPTATARDKSSLFLVATVIALFSISLGQSLELRDGPRERERELRCLRDMLGSIANDGEEDERDKLG